MKKRRNFLLRIIGCLLAIVVILSIIILTNKPRESTITETVFSYTILPIQKRLYIF